MTRTQDQRDRSFTTRDADDRDNGTRSFGGGEREPFNAREQYRSQIQNYGRFDANDPQHISLAVDRLRDLDRERNILMSLLGIGVVSQHPFSLDTLRGGESGRNWGDNDVFGQQGQHGRQQTRGLGLRGIAPKNTQREDNQIKDEVITRLTEADDIDPSDVQIEVKAGEVTLTGTVDDRHTKLAIDYVAGNVTGVKDVNNQIRVNQQTRGSEALPNGRQSADKTRSSVHPS